MRRLVVSTLCLGFLLFAGIANAQDETILEGHVFNLQTGVPIHRAEVTIPNEDWPNIPLRVGTDQNGFYTLTFLSDGPVELVGFCSITTSRRGRAHIVGDTTTTTVVPRPGVMRRDLYLDVTRRRGAVVCDVVAHPASF